MRLRIGLGVGLIMSAVVPAWSQAAQSLVTPIAGMASQELFGMVISLGPLLFGVLASFLYLRIRGQWIRSLEASKAEIATLQGRLAQSETLLSTDPQILVVWAGAAAPPHITGTLPGVKPPVPTARGVSFAAWLDPGDCAAIDLAIEALRQRGEAFERVARTRQGAFVSIEGRAVGESAVLRVRDVSADRAALARGEERYRKLAEEFATLRALLDTAPLPIWMRDASGRLVWVNRFYARAVEATDEADALRRGAELLESATRDAVLRARSAGQAFTGRVPAVVGTARRILDVIDTPSTHGSAGLAVDVTDLEAMRNDLGRQTDAHARTLDQLATAVAIFDKDRRLTFYNASFRSLWQLDPAFLDDKPTDGELLDRLRAQRKLEEHADFRAWKNRLHEAYTSIDTREHWWHLPGGQTLRVVTTPNPTGGVTYLYEDVSERIDLETRFNAMARMQGETLDALKEGVATFGSDGRMRLSNPAFARIWKLSPVMLAERPHIDTIIQACMVLYGDADSWRGFKASITGLGDSRLPFVARMTRADGGVIDTATLPLPDGGTLATFTDVTHTVAFEKALVEKNAALEDAARIKSNFVHHVSYELRSPLTAIIGFVQILADGSAGPLTEKQREYAGYIMTSSDALLAIINNILDLATIDAGVMTLDLGDVDVRETMDAAAEGVRHRLAERGVALEIVASSGIGTFRADAKRVLQILFNLLSNAIGFSDRGGTVTLSATREGGEMLFRVRDSGKGIPEAMIARVFDRFETHTRGSDHRGVGLGLSIVRSFVELHGGRVEIDTVAGAGTTVTCRFPLPGDSTLRDAAE
ncbi:MAG: ATP-binding protein [Labrys sp. (in: a-proteobacteria)]